MIYPVPQRAQTNLGSQEVKDTYQHKSPNQLNQLNFSQTISKHIFDVNSFLSQTICDVISFIKTSRKPRSVNGDECCFELKFESCRFSVRP
jgi:hypothetical protein